MSILSGHRSCCWSVQIDIEEQSTTTRGDMQCVKDTSYLYSMCCAAQQYCIIYIYISRLLCGAWGRVCCWTKAKEEATTHCCASQHFPFPTAVIKREKKKIYIYILQVLWCCLGHRDDFPFSLPRQNTQHRPPLSPSNSHIQESRERGVYHLIGQLL